MRQKIEEKGAEGWELVSTSAFEAADGALVEILWFKRQVPSNVAVVQAPKWLGFQPPSMDD